MRVSAGGWQRPSSRFCESAHCVEAVRIGGHVFVRASGEQREVTLTQAEFGSFISAVKAGEYDHMVDSL